MNRLDIESDAEAARRKVVEQVDAIHRLEGFDPEDAPHWFHDLTEDYVQGRVTAEHAIQIALAKIKSTSI
jgi:RecA/RadA recombinase